MINPFDLPRELADNAFTELVLGEDGRVAVSRTREDPPKASVTSIAPTTILGPAGPLSNAIDSTKSRMFQDERRRTKALEEELKTLRAEHENLKIDHGKLRVAADEARDPSQLEAALDAHAESERRLKIVTERAERAEKDLVHVREALADAKAKISELTERVGTIAELTAKLERFEKLGEDLKKLSESAR